MARKYENSHQWITFSLDLQEVSYKTWHLLGEAKALCNFFAGTPLLPETQEHLNRVFLAKGVHGTVAIEGNTLTEDQVLERVKGKLKLPPSKEYLGQEIDNVIEACNWIVGEILQGNKFELSVNNINKFNGLVLKDLPLEEDVKPGEIRDYSVGVTGVRYVGAPAEDLPYLMDRLVEWMDSDVWKSNNERDVSLEILKAIVAHIYIAWIHPYGDGNGRVARLVELQILFDSGLPNSATHLFSNFYNETRTEYYRQLDRTSKSGGDISQFLFYALQGFVDSLKAQAKIIQNQQLEVHWINHVYSLFKNKDKKTEKRQRRLILDLTEKYLIDKDYSFDAFIPIEKLRFISPRIAEAYAGKSDRPIERDVKILEEMDLIVKEGKNVRLNLGMLLTFMNPTKPEES